MDVEKELRRRKKRRLDEPAPRSPLLNRRVILVLLLVAAPLLVVVALVLAGKLSLEEIRGRERYQLPFADIECTPPPGQSRDGFLAEVRYLTELPDQLPLLEEGLAARLASAFALHPWVEKVERVEIVPPHRVLVQLVYRTPVLAVRQGEQVRAVDRRGILLPTTAITDGLPVFQGKAKPPAGPTGTPWGDPAVEEAARAAARS